MRITETCFIRISIEDDRRDEYDIYLEAYAELLTNHDEENVEYIDMTTDGGTYTYTWEVTL